MRPKECASRNLARGLLVAILFAASGCQSDGVDRPLSTETGSEADSERGGSQHRLAAVLARTRVRLHAQAISSSSEATRRSTDDFFSALIESAWRVAHAARYLEAPSFSAGKGIVGLPGLFNPDNRYSSALLEPQGSYRIWGTRGSHSRFSLQFLDTYPLVGLSKGLMVINLDELGIEPGEDFDLLLGGEASDDSRDLWWPLPETVQAVLARQTFNDWAKETASVIRIARLDGSRDLPRGPTHADLAADYLERITDLWSDHHLAELGRLPENVMPPGG
jgi:hypothetical protein